MTRKDAVSRGPLARSSAARFSAAVLLAALASPQGTAQETLEKIRLPAADPWLAKRENAFAFRHAPGREEIAWFVSRAREDAEAVRSGRYELAWADRSGGTVHVVDLGANVCYEVGFVGPVWNHDASRIAIAIPSRIEGLSPTNVVVVDTKTSAATTWLEDVYPAALSWTADGRWLAVGDGEQLRVLKGPNEQVWRADIPYERGWGSAAAVAPDGNSALAVSARGVFVLKRDVAEPERLGDVPRDATIFTAPQWSPDGTKAIAAAGGGIVWIDVANKFVRGTGEAALAGRAHGVVWVPGTEHALAFVEQVRDGSALSVLLGAGHARQHYSMLPVLVAGDGTRVLPLTKLRTKTPDPRFTMWFYRPQSSEAQSRWSR